MDLTPLLGWRHHEFRGTKWVRVKQSERQRHLENAYRVLLTRARQGMVLVVPDGEAADATRRPELYDSTYSFLAKSGVEAINML